jgi:hypothetical protein
VESPIVTERASSSECCGSMIVRDLASRGSTEVAYQPAGPDIPRELTAFARMCGLQAA